MKTTLALTLALTASAHAHQSAELPSPPATSLVGTTTIPFTMDFDKPVIELTINGAGPYPFILDTGAAPFLIVNDDLVRELDLPTGDKGRVGDPMNPDAIETTDVHVDAIRVGDARFENFTAITWDNTAFFHGEGAPRGIIGMTMFADLLTTFDFPKGTVSLRKGSLPEPNGEDIIAYTAPGGIPKVTFTINDQPYTASLDTGSPGGFTLPISEAESLPFREEPEVVGEGRTVNSAFKIYSATLDGTLTFGPQTLVDPQINFTDGFDHGNIGCGALENLRLTFDQHNHRLRIEPDQTRRASKPKQRKRYGIMAGQNPQTGEMTVSRCVEGSPADRAGVREGDTILAINGTPIADLSGAERMKAFKSSPIILTLLRDGQELEIELSLDDE